MALYKRHRARKHAAAARKETLNLLLRRTPDPDRADPRDLIALQRAKDHLGDFKLKIHESKHSMS